ncbi:PAS domain S-box protein [Ectothiorhodospira haloalkaliphila]|uniref:ATP-binding protein n=1 Tax=Ectothiorhodospira haloalkaliphila TaxID=421628 RepID=UPI001EE910A2|nr:ATP-binding protein [Ectothiorhodospira haloalkaliphila]MCG5524640.1 PAS domain S-box protein [Ectothiorhodospira haloalkaliphila]
MTQDDVHPNHALKRAQHAVEQGDFEQAEDLLKQGEVSLAELVQTLSVYESELEIQNAELRESQFVTQRLLDNYAAFFGGLPMASLVVDQSGMILEANEEATKVFRLDVSHLRRKRLCSLVEREHEAIVQVALRQAEREGQARLANIRFSASPAQRDHFPGELHVARLPGRDGRDVEFACALVDLTERVRHEEELRIAHEQLRESERGYRIAAQHSPDWDYWYGADGRYVYVSPGCEDISGYPPEAFLKDPDLMYTLFSPEDAQRWRQHLAQVTHQEGDLPHMALEFAVHRPDGEIRWIEHHCQPVVDDDGTYLGRRGVNRDITERKLAQARLEQIFRLYATRTQVNQCINRIDDEGTLLHRTASIVVEQGGLDACAISLRHRGDAQLKKPVVHGLTEEQARGLPLQETWEILRGNPWECLNDRPLLCKDCESPDTPEAWREWAGANGIRTCVHFVLFRGDELLGLASFMGRDKDLFTEDVLHSLRGIVEDTSHALHQMERERKRRSIETAAQEREAKTLAFTQAIIDSLRSSICVLDHEGTIIAVNRAWDDFSRHHQGAQDPVAQGVNYFSLCSAVQGESADEARRVATGIRQVLSGQMPHFEDEYRIAGTAFMVLATPLDGGPTSGRQLVISHKDISERKQTEEDLRRAKEEAERASRAKSEFLSNMSHELRTPMNAVLGFAQLLETDPTLDEIQADSVGEILKGGRHLLDLINEVLDLASVEAGRVELSIESIPLRELVRECLMLLTPLADARQIRIDPGHDEDCVVLADRIRLKQVMINLLSNAIKYNRDGGDVRLDIRSDFEGWLRISVTDTGKGISPDKLDQLFQPFSRLEGCMEGVEGTGIGLAISRRLMEVMGGEIGVDSQPGEGSTFWLRLPQGVQESVEVSRMEPSSQPASMEDATQTHTVLHIDDNPANLRLVAQILTRRPHLRLLSAPDPSLGLELATAHAPDLILLDINMPELDGYQVLKRLRASPDTATIPVMALTAFATERDVERGISAGFDEYLTKPLDVEHFLSVLDALLQKAQKEDGPLSRDQASQTTGVTGR